MFKLANSNNNNSKQSDKPQQPLETKTFSNRSNTNTRRKRIRSLNNVGSLDEAKHNDEISLSHEHSLPLARQWSFVSMMDRDDDDQRAQRPSRLHRLSASPVEWAAHRRTRRVHDDNEPRSGSASIKTTTTGIVSQRRDEKQDCTIRKWQQNEFKYWRSLPWMNCDTMQSPLSRRPDCLELRENLDLDFNSNGKDDNEANTRVSSGQQLMSSNNDQTKELINRHIHRPLKYNTTRILLFSILIIQLISLVPNVNWLGGGPPVGLVDGSLIIGDSAIEIQEVDSGTGNGLNSNTPANNGPDVSGLNSHEQQQHHQPVVEEQHHHALTDNQPNLILGSTSGSTSAMADGDNQLAQLAGSGGSAASSPQADPAPMPPHLSFVKEDQSARTRMPSGPLPPLGGGGGKRGDDITDGDKKSRNSHDYDIHELNLNESDKEKDALSHILAARPHQTTADQQQPEDNDDKAIAGKVVDFELTPAGGHNKAKIKKKKKKKKEKNGEESFKKWGKKKKAEKKAMEKKEKEHMKKKKEEGEWAL